MRVRALDAQGDYSFGHGEGDFLIDSRAAVGQNVMTRLGLWVGEWFLDTTEGTPWSSRVLSADTRNTIPIFEQAIRDRILGTQDVLSIQEFTSDVNPSTRRLTVQMTISTVFGQLAVGGTL